MTEGSSPKPSFKDRMSGFGKKFKESKVADAAKYVGRGAEELSVATGATALARESAGLMTPAKNWGAEKAVATVKGVDRAGSHVGNAGKAVWDRLGGAKDYLQKYLAVEPFEARVQERSKALVDFTFNEPADWAGEAGSWMTTMYQEKIAPGLDNIGLIISPDSLLDREEKKAKRTKKRAEKKAKRTKERAEKKAKISGEVDSRVDSASSIAEGSDLMALGAEGMESAQRYDALPNKNGFALAERMFDGLLSEEVQSKTKELNELRKAVIESRGDKDKRSWDHERKLTEKSEKKQREAIQLGIDVLDLLPESVAYLDRTTLNKARAKSIDLARKNNGIIRNLTSIAKSVEDRFPDKADEIRRKLVEITTPLREKNDVAKSIYEKVNTDELMKSASGDLYAALIRNSETFNQLTETQQDLVTKDLGATRKDGIDEKNRNERYDSESKSTYDVALNAYSEYAKLTMAYEAMINHVDKNPELACQLVVMAERVVQAEQVLKLASSKFKAELLIKSKQIRDKENNKAYDATHTAQEQASRKDRKDYYVKILNRQAARIEKEGPTVKKINKYILVAGGATAAAIAGVEGLSGVVQSAPEVIALLKQAYSVVAGVAGNIDLSGAAAAAGLGTSIWGAAKFSEWLGGKIGKGVEGQSDKVATESATAIKGSVAELANLAGSLDADNPAKAQLEKIIKGLSTS